MGQLAVLSYWDKRKPWLISQWLKYIYLYNWNSFFLFVYFVIQGNSVSMKMIHLKVRGSTKTVIVIILLFVLFQFEIQNKVKWGMDKLLFLQYYPSVLCCFANHASMLLPEACCDIRCCSLQNFYFLPFAAFSLIVKLCWRMTLN